MANDNNDIIPVQTKNTDHHNHFFNTNESVHVVIDQKFDELVDIIIKYLKYDLYRQAVDEDIKMINDKKPDIIEMAGKTFDEYLKYLRMMEGSKLSYPLKSSFTIKDEDNPCKDWIASDCVYEFTIEEAFNVQGAVDTNDAFVTKTGDGFCLHNVKFSFIGTTMKLYALKGTIRHEIKHAYTEFMYHRGLYKKNNDSRDITKLGEFNDSDEIKKEKIYQNIVADANTLKKSKRITDFDAKCHIKCAEFILKCLYYLSDKEIMANYSTYYEDCKISHNKSFTIGIYRVYAELLDGVINGIYVEKMEDDIQYPVKVKPFDDDFIFDKLSKYSKYILRHIPKTKSEFEANIRSRIKSVMDRMKRIYKYVHKNDKSAYENYIDSIDRYYDALEENCKEIYGEDAGIVVFTQKKCYETPDFLDVINEIDNRIFKTL